MSALPSLDLHAHVDVAIDPYDLEVLKSAVFAVTRSLDEAKVAVQRADPSTVWGVGCHPGVIEAHDAFSDSDFEDLIERAAFVGELGLDGKARVPLDRQRATLRKAFQVLADRSRIVSLHSYGACREVLDEVERAGLKGAVLHWWLGDEQLTRRAVALGCWFSINAAQAGKSSALGAIPVERMLTETDHPFGDRQGQGSHRPGGTESVEARLARSHGASAAEIRVQVWRNLNDLVVATDTFQLLPRAIRAHLAAL